MKNKKLIFVLVILAIIAMISFNYNKIYSFFVDEKIQSQENTKKDLGVPVKSSGVVKEKITEKLSYTGTIYSNETVEIISKIPTKITEITVSEGDMVKKGQVIARLDNESTRAKLNSIQAKINTMEFNLEYLTEEEEKYQALLEEGGITQSSYDKVSHERGMLEMQLKELYASKNEINVNLKDTILTAPISGKVRIVNNSIGDLAVTGKPIAVIDDISQLAVKINVSESDLKKVKLETPVLLGISGIDEKVMANVTQIGSSINPKTRIGEVEVGNLKLEENEKVILGTSVETEFILKEVEEGYTIPFNAVKELSDKKVVYKIEENHVKEVPIVTGLKIDNRIQVVDGLAEGDEIVVGNTDKLYNNAEIYLFKGAEE